MTMAFPTHPEPPAEDAIVRHEVTIEASPDEIWEAVATEDGRERWLEPDPEREIHVESEREPGRAHPADPGRIVWWWWHADRDEVPHRVEVLVVAAPAGARVIVTETAPAPLVALALARLEAMAALVLA